MFGTPWWKAFVISSISADISIEVTFTEKSSWQGHPAVSWQGEMIISYAECKRQCTIFIFVVSSLDKDQNNCRIYRIWLERKTLLLYYTRYVKRNRFVPQDLLNAWHYDRLYRQDCEPRLKIKHAALACSSSALWFVCFYLCYLLSFGTYPHAVFGQYSSQWLMSLETEAPITLGLISLQVFKRTLGQSFNPHTSVISISFLIPLALFATAFCCT